ncbi:murein biosynthesis integral membrane protein MurJ [soil metagenome]
MVETPEQPGDPGIQDEAGSSLNSGLAMAAAIIFAGNAASRALGLIREQLAAGMFGAGDRIAAFTIADNLNTLLFDLMINGMLQAAMIPVLAVMAVVGIRQTEHFRSVMGTLLLLALSAGIAIAITGIFAAPAFVSLMTALANDADIRGSGARKLAIQCTRIILPGLPFLAGATVLTAGLFAIRRPAGPAIGTACRNAAVVILILLLGSRWGVRSMAAGVVAGAVLMFAIQLVALHRNRALPVPGFDVRNPEVIRVFQLFAPVFLGLLVSSAVVVIDRNLAWGAQENAVGAMRYATSLVQMVLGLVAAAISLAALPRLAQSFASGDIDGFNDGLYRALALVSILIIPAVFALGALGRPIVGLLFEHGETGQRASRLILVALIAYLPGHLLAAYDQVLIFAFYARQNTLLPVTAGVVASLAYVAFAFALVDRYEMAGLVAANSVQLGLHTLLMTWLARKQFGNSPFAPLLPLLGKTLIAAAIMAVMGWIAYRGMDAALPVWRGLFGQFRELLIVSIPLLVSALVYFLLMRSMRVSAFTDLTDAAAGKFNGLRARS